MAEREVAYIHPQGICPDGIFFEASKVEELLDRGVIWQCPDCGSEDPAFPTYGITGNGEDDEDERNLNIVLRYEVSATAATADGW